MERPVGNLSSTPINYLSEDALLHIFSFLKCKDLGVVAQVSKLWDCLSSDDYIWRSLYREEVSNHCQGFVGLKDKFKKNIHDKWQEQINYALENRAIIVDFNMIQDNHQIFSDHLISILNDSSKSLREKNRALHVHLDSPRFPSPPLFTFSVMPWDTSKIVEMLLKAGANPNISIDDHLATPLMRASYYGKLNIVKLLLDNGADPSIKNSNDHTAWDLAVQQQSFLGPRAFQELKRLLSPDNAPTNMMECDSSCLPNLKKRKRESKLG